jgi:hypothetical protein
VQNGMGVVGIPDIIACWDGRFLAIETKAPGKRGNVTANQRRQLDAINNAGGIAVVIDDPTEIEVLLSANTLTPHNNGDKNVS